MDGFNLHANFPVKDAGSVQLLDAIGSDHGDIKELLVRFRIKMPLCLMKEWVKLGPGLHRTEMDLPEPLDVWIPGNIRSARTHVYTRELYKWGTASGLYSYNMLICAGVDKSTAMSVLPQNILVEFIEYGTLISYDFLNRIMADGGARKEMFDFAQLISDLIRAQFPNSWNMV